jgi:hypothetical protein
VATSRAPVFGNSGARFAFPTGIHLLLVVVASKCKSPVRGWP